jgi:SOS-response transcriptional repressor LexA
MPGTAASSLQLLRESLRSNTLARKNGRVFLVPANEEYPELDITEQEDVMVWRVVTYATHKVSAAALGMK